MKAIVYERYGSPEVLRLAEVEKPVPRDDEALIKVVAASLNGSDREGLAGKPLYARMAGLSRPRHRILGSDIAGRVEAVGKNHAEFKPGDEVFGEIPGYRGGLAEYVCTHGKTLARKPARLSFEQAAAIPQGGVIALRGIREVGRVQPGHHVLVNGAGGSAGSFAVQLAKLEGAEVTGVDHPGKLDFIRSLGADHVIDCTRQDFTRTGSQYDLILDLIAYRSLLAYRRALRRNGSCFVVGGSVAVVLKLLLLGRVIGRVGSKHLRVLIVPQNRKDLLAVSALCEAGKLAPAIDRRFALAEVPDAFRYLVEGHALGKLVITIGHAG